MPLSKTAKTELEEKKQKLLEVIDEMIENGERISFYSVASKANCSRTFLYNFEFIRNKIEKNRNINPNRPKDNFKDVSKREAFNYISLDAYMEDYNFVYKLLEKYASEKGLLISNREARYDRRVDMIIKYNNEYIYVEIKYYVPKVPYFVVWFLGYEEKPSIAVKYLEENKIDQEKAFGLIFDDIANLFKILDNELVDCKLILKEKNSFNSYIKIDEFKG